MNKYEKKDNENIELTLLLTAIKIKYGYDFMGYTKIHIKRRVMHRLRESNISSISELQYRILYDKHFFDLFLLDFSIHVTEMFRDPTFYKMIRDVVVPILNKYSHLKIWHAGCSSGEEVYSMGILLKEENLLEKTIQYATDFNEKILQIAKDSIYSIKKIQDYTRNYQQAGGKESLSEYYAAAYDSIKLKNFLSDSVIFSAHNLAIDNVFGEMNMIICRNVMIYFDKDLQNKVFKLFYNSLCHGGILCLGTKETIRFSDIENKFIELNSKERIYKKIG